MPQNNDKRIFAIGDVHGCNTELQLLLRQLPLDAGSTVVFLGDYVDRGDDSRGVIDTILELSKRVKVVALRGNHEEMMLDFLERPESAGAGLFVFNGGSTTLSSYEGQKGHFDIPPAHLEFLRNLKYFYETEDYFFVHAGVPNIPLRKLNIEEHGDQMLWVRSSFMNSTFRWEKLIVHGHTPVDHPELLEKRINVDTGCVYDNRLTAVELPSKKIYQVEKQPRPHAQRAERSEASSGGRIAERFIGAVKLYVHVQGAEPMEFETLNYTEFGALIRCSAPPVPLVVGQSITGTIGVTELSSLKFNGVVVRTEMRDQDILYGIRLEIERSPGETL